MPAENNLPTAAPPRIRVLIVDDSAAFRNAFGQWLARWPQVEVVGVAGDSEDGLVLVDRTRPDLVLVDLQMPRINGLQATRKIRAGFPEMHVIMITLHDSVELKSASAAAGAEWFIAKCNLRAELPCALAQLFPDRQRETAAEKGVR